MQKLTIFLFICLVVVLTVLTYPRVLRMVRADQEQFSRLDLISKSKYLVKCVRDVVTIHLLGQRHRDPGEDLISGKKVLLLGASIGNEWRIGEYYPFVENLAVYKFDKRDALKSYLHGERKPDAVILKECAAYIQADRTKFETEFQNYVAVYQDTVKEISLQGIIPIVTTICPVASSGTHLDNILKMNDWIRAFSKAQGITLFDLELAVRISPQDRRLRSDLCQNDGLHLNRIAYEKHLNPLVVPVLLTAFGFGSNK